MLAIAVWLAAANTFGILAILPSGAATAAATTAIGPTLLAGALRLADAAHAFAVLAALAFRAAAAGSAAAVITAGLAGAAGGARLAAAAALILYLADADVVPHGFAAEGIDGADTGLNARIAAARSFKGCTAVAAASALATVGGADLAVLAPLTLPVTASGAGVALATAEGGNLVDADFIPLHFAAERVLLADTIGHATIVAAGVGVRRAAVGPGTLATVLRARQAALVVLALSVAAASGAAVAAPKVGDFVDADAIPFEIAAEGILIADTGLDRGVVAASCLLNGAATAGAAAGAAIIGAGGAVLIYGTVSVAAGVAAAAVTGIPGAGGLAITDVVVSPIARVVCLAAGTGAAVAGAEVGPGAADTTPLGFHFTDANVVPLGFAAVGIGGADTAGDGGIGAARSAVGLAAVAVPGARAAVLRAGGTVFVIVAAAVTAEGLAAPTVIAIPGAGAVAIAQAVIVPAAGIVGGAAGTGAAIAGAEVGPGAALATALRFDFPNADVVPLSFAAEGIGGADTAGDGSIITTWGAVGGAAIAAPAALAAVLGAVGAGLVVVAVAVATEAAASALPATVAVNFLGAEVVPGGLTAE